MRWVLSAPSLCVYFPSHAQSVQPSVQVMCKLGDVPPHLQFNRDILTGYRPPLSLKGCLQSVCYLHNESFNIYSHAFCFFYFVLFSWEDYASLGQLFKPLYVFIALDFLGATIPFVLSTVYHTFMCHHSGKQTYQQLLKLDLLGVWFAATFGSLSSLYTSLYCFAIVRHVYLLLYMLTSSIILYYLLVVNCKRKRVLALTVQYFFRVIAHVLQLTLFDAVDPGATKFILLTDIASATGALINALHIPERWFSGKGADYVFNGHSLMHIMAFITFLSSRQTLLYDLAWLNKGGNCIGISV